MEGKEEFKKKLSDPVVVAYIILGLLPLFSMFIPATDILFFFRWFYLLSGVGCAYWCITKKYSFKNIVPIFLVLSMSFIYFNNASTGYNYWPYPFAFALLSSALWIAGMNVEVAFVLAIILSGAMIHLVPALLTNLLEEIDPYYHYKWAEIVTDTGKMPIHDWLTYPKLGGLDRSTMPLTNSLSIAFFGYILKFFGYTLYDSAMLMPVVSTILTLLVAYVVLKEAYWRHPSAKYAAMFGVFIMMLSIGWSTKAHATDSEDDVTGGLGLLASMMFLLMAINRDSVKMSVIGGFVFGWLITLYDGQRLLTMVVFLAIALMAVVGIFKDKRAFVYLKHFSIIWVVGQFLSRFILHYGEGIGFGLYMITNLELASIALAVGAVALNELYVNHRKVSKNQLTILTIVAVIAGGAFVGAQFYKAAFVDARQSSVVFKTIAEQAPFATDIVGYINSLNGIFGVASMLSLAAMFGLAYLGWKEYNFNYVLFAVWQAVLTWGLFYKSQYMFAASMPFALVGSFFALYVIREKKDLDGFAIIPTLILIGISLTYLPMSSFLFKYDPTAIMFQAASYERVGWEPALQFFKNQSANTAVVTWWDYGHWLTAVSHKFVLIDNLQRDHWEIQEVAKFFMKETSEEKATDILRGYQTVYDGGEYKRLFGGVNLRYVTIDWTMVGKSGAMRFIATGNLTNQSNGEYNSYIQCGFTPQYSNVNGSMMTNPDGSFASVKTLVFACQQNPDGLGGVMFMLTGDNKMNVYAVDVSGGQVPWGTWINTHNSSLFGVMSPQDILGVCTQYSGSIDRISPTYTTFVYGSKDFKNLMLAKLYFGEYIDSYRSLGLADVNWTPLRYYKKVQSFENGFVDVWEISPEAYGKSPVNQNDTFSWVK